MRLIEDFGHILVFGGLLYQSASQLYDAVLLLVSLAVQPRVCMWFLPGESIV